MPSAASQAHAGPPADAGVFTGHQLAAQGVVLLPAHRLGALRSRLRSEEPRVGCDVETTVGRVNAETVYVTGARDIRTLLRVGTAGRYCKRKENQQGEAGERPGPRASLAWLHSVRHSRHRAHPVTVGYRVHRFCFQWYAARRRWLAIPPLTPHVHDLDFARLRLNHVIS